MLDFERLDLLLQAYEESGLSSRHSREYLHAKEVHANLSLPEWVNAEIKEAVVSVVWGANNQTSVIRLTNLIKRVSFAAGLLFYFYWAFFRLTHWGWKALMSTPGKKLLNVFARRQ